MEQVGVRWSQEQQCVESLTVDFLIDRKGEHGTTIEQSPVASMPVASTSGKHGQITKQYFSTTTQMAFHNKVLPEEK
jgi:hypothetical protein